MSFDRNNGPPRIDQQSNRRRIGDREAATAERRQGLEPGVLAAVDPGGAEPGLGGGQGLHPGPAALVPQVQVYRPAQLPRFPARSRGLLRRQSQRWAALVLRKWGLARQVPLFQTFFQTGCGQLL